MYKVIVVSILGLLLAVLLLATVFAAKDFNPDGGHLIIRKRIHTEYDVLAENHNFTVEIILYNVGKSDALEVSLKDSWSTESFEIREGSLSANWDSIPAGTNVTNNVTLAPLQEGHMSGFRALVQYKSTVEGPIIYAYSSPMRPYDVVNEEFFLKATAKHYLEWFIFSAGTFAAIVIPFVSWYSTNTEYKTAAQKRD